MTDTVPARKPSARKPSARARDSAIGTYRHKRSLTDIGLGLLGPLISREFLDRHGLRVPFNRGLKFGVTRVFAAAGATTRQFTKPTRPPPLRPS